MTTAGAPAGLTAPAHRAARRGPPARLEWAAEALGAAAPIDVPPSLTRVARFAPTKRAKLAGTALARPCRTTPHSGRWLPTGDPGRIDVEAPPTRRRRYLT